MLRGIGRFNAEQSSDDDAESQPTPFRFDIKCSSIAPIPTQLRGEDGHDVDVVLLMAFLPPDASLSGCRAGERSENWYCHHPGHHLPDDTPVVRGIAPQTAWAVSAQQAKAEAQRCLGPSLHRAAPSRPGFLNVLSLVPRLPWGLSGPASRVRV